MATGDLFERLWRDYVAVTPQASRIHELLRQRGERVINDHVALRTFARPRVDIEALARPFVALGYHPGGDYAFAGKGLTARHYQHPDPDLPKVFISQLELDRFSARLGAIVDGLLAAVSDELAASPELPSAGRPWPVDRATYDALAAESEYAAWVAAFGYRANHFTVDVGRLRSVRGLAELIELLQAQGFELNDSGGLIKGSPEVFLEQAATRADEVPVELADGSHRLPSCYYEFARRYHMPDGALFQGFVTGSADRLFESTDRRR